MYFLVVAEILGFLFDRFLFDQKINALKLPTDAGLVCASTVSLIETRHQNEAFRIGNRRSINCNIHFIIPGNKSWDLRGHDAWNFRKDIFSHMVVKKMVIYLKQRQAQQIEESKQIFT